MGFVTKSNAFIDSLSHFPPHPPEEITPFLSVINLQEDKATFGFFSINSYCFSSLSGRHISSASILAIYLPCAYDIALLRDDGSLKFTSLVYTFTRLSKSSYFFKISWVLSVEQSLIIISSKSLNV